MKFQINTANLVLLFAVVLTVLSSNISAQQSGTIFGEKKIIASDGAASASFGEAAAIDGDTAVIGARNTNIGSNMRQGAAYVFVRRGGTWIFQQKLVANDGAFNDIFGSSVAILGNRIVVGAIGDNGNVGNDEGSAYVFERSGNVWTQTQKLTASDPSVDKMFGFSIGISPNTIMIGARNDNSVRGAVYVFEVSQSVWTQKQKLSANNAQPSDVFGLSLKISDGFAYIGAPGAGANDQGAVYVFSYSNGNWTESTSISPTDGQPQDSFGISLDKYGNTLIVGAHGADIHGVTDQGAVYVYNGSGSAWTEVQKIWIPEFPVYENFGYKVAISSKAIAVSAIGAANGNNADQGAVYVFRKSGTSYARTHRILASDGSASELLGVGMGLSGSTIVAGAPADIVNGNVNQGSAYLFQIENNTPFDFDADGRSDLSIYRPSNGQWWYQRSSDAANRVITFGISTDKLVPADYTGDGKTDIAVWRESSGEWFILRSEDGSFYSFPFGSAGDIPAPADFDGDGRSDAAVFRPSSGTWYVVRSTGGILVESFGANGDVPVAADYDGDGLADIAVFRVSVGAWWIKRSSAGIVQINWGASDVRPVVGDYTGDGKADIAFWRPVPSYYGILRSEDFSFYYVTYGNSSDIPAPGDFDGDGKFDLSLFRPSNNVWYQELSTNGPSTATFGTSNDRPVPSAFVR